MNINDFLIRSVEKTEVHQLAEISINTYFETFVNECNSSDMEMYLNDSFNSEILSNELNNPESQFYFVEYLGKIIGYLKLNKGKAQTESILDNALEIERLYVLAEFQGMKLGQILMNKSIEIAKSENTQNVWLGVWENNKKAIKFYEKNGFVVFDSHLFMVGNDKQTDLLMKFQIF